MKIILNKQPKFVKQILEIIFKLRKHKQQDANANDALNASVDDDIALLGTNDLPDEQGFIA